MTQNIEVTVTYGKKIYDVTANYYFGHPGSWEEPPDSPSIEGIDIVNATLEEVSRLFCNDEFMSLVNDEIQNLLLSRAEKQYNEYEGELL